MRVTTLRTYNVTYTSDGRLKSHNKSIRALFTSCNSQTVSKDAFDPLYRGLTSAWMSMISLFNHQVGVA